MKKVIGRRMPTAPVQGKLVGAGYIDIKFDGTLENASGYQVYFDGKNECDLVDGTKAVMTFDAKGLSKEAKCEVYTTQVSAHTAYVVATMDDGTEVKLSLIHISEPTRP